MKTPESAIEAVEMLVDKIDASIESDASAPCETVQDLKNLLASGL